MPHYEAALAIEPDAVLPLNNLAWVLATCFEPALRDGPKAVELAKRAVSFSGGNDPIGLRTLAAAYAESGRFPEAIAVVNQALPLARAAGNLALAADLEANLADFGRRRPVRDASLTTPEPLP